MGTPEEKNRKRMRIKSKIAKELRTPKFRQRIKEDAKKKPVDVKKLTHAELVQLISDKDGSDE